MMKKLLLSVMTLLCLYSCGTDLSEIEDRLDDLEQQGQDLQRKGNDLEKEGDQIQKDIDDANKDINDLNQKLNAPELLSLTFWLLITLCNW